jgi:hypothetical protein
MLRFSELTWNLFHLPRDVVIFRVSSKPPEVKVGGLVGWYSREWVAGDV